MKTSFLASATLLAVSVLAHTAEAGDFGITFGGKDWQVTLGDNGPHHRPRTHRRHQTRRPHQQRQVRCGLDQQIFPQSFTYENDPHVYPSQDPVFDAQPVTNDYPPVFNDQPIAQNLPKSMQGRWYEVSPDNTRYIYDLRSNDYDMYEVDPATNQVMMGQDGLPIMLQGEPLAYSNGMLTLSPGPDQDGPLMVGAPPAKYPQGKTMTPMTGGAARYFTRRPVKTTQIKTVSNSGPKQVKGHNVQKVEFTMNGTPSQFVQIAKGTWVEINPEGATQFQETGRDEWSVYLTRTDGVVKAQLDLYRKMIIVDGRDTHQIFKAE